MIQTKQILIRRGILNHLQKLQSEIDALPDYKAQVKQAKLLWQNKKKSNAQKAAFKRIEKELQKLAIGKDQCCNYCESNAGSTIEHVYPRGFFPNKTFVWENFLWACKQCNGKHKISQFQIFESPSSSKIILLQKDHSFTQPINSDAVFINPRTENPLDYIQLDLETGLFHPIDNKKNSRAYKRAVYTIEILQLNSRVGLVEFRKKAYQQYLDLLQHYIKANQNQDQKKALGYQKEILVHWHATVWVEMQRQAMSITGLKDLFEQAPEALGWAY